MLRRHFWRTGLKRYSILRCVCICLSLSSGSFEHSIFADITDQVSSSKYVFGFSNNIDISDQHLRQLKQLSTKFTFKSNEYHEFCIASLTDAVVSIQKTFQFFFCFEEKYFWTKSIKLANKLELTATRKSIRKFGSVFQLFYRFLWPLRFERWPIKILSKLGQEKAYFSWKQLNSNRVCIQIHLIKCIKRTELSLFRVISA